MRTCLLIVAILFFTIGCKNKNGVPSNVLAPKKMQAILWDMMRADQFLADYVLSKDTSLKKISESLKYYQQIFAVHKISKEEFQQSFAFYSTHPVLLKTIMDSLAAPPIDTVVKVIQPKLIKDTGITIKFDTNSKRADKTLPKNSKPRKRKKQFVFK